MLSTVYWNGRIKNRHGIVVVLLMIAAFNSYQAYYYFQIESMLSSFTATTYG